MPTKGYKGIGMEGSVARYYDRVASKPVMRGQYKAWAEKLAPLLQPGCSVLEVAPGPGYLAIELSLLGFQVTGLDISQTLVDISIANAQKEAVLVDFRRGNASDMPFKKDMFDFIICTAAFKNFTQPIEALKEMERVLKPGYKACVIDLRRDVTDKAIDNYAEKEMKLSGWEKFSMGLTFKYFLRRRAYTRPQLETMVAQTFFARHWIEDNEIGFELWLQKVG